MRAGNGSPGAARDIPGISPGDSSRVEGSRTQPPGQCDQIQICPVWRFTGS